MIHFTSWPEHVTAGKRAKTGKPQRDYAQCDWNGRNYQLLLPRLSATTALARKLVADGCPDQPWECYVEGQRSLFGPSLHAWAKRIVSERDSGGFVIQPFTEHPHALPRGGFQMADEDADDAE